MTSTINSPTDIERLIVERLGARVKDAGLVKFVYDTKQYADAEEQSQLVPALAVIYNGYEPTAEEGRGLVQAVEFEFLTVIITRSSANTLRSTGAKTMASEIFHETVQALTGWKPAPGVGRLKLSPGPGAGYSDAGFVYMPVAWKARVTYTPKPD